MDLGLAGRVYLVTGGSKGLGFATAKALVDDGAKVVISSRTKENVDAAVAELGDAAAGVAGDNADPELAMRLIAEAKDRFGRLDGMLVSVGGPPLGTVLETPEEAWTASFEAVFMGTLRLARAVAAELGDGGAIAFVLSTSVREPIEDLAVSGGLRPGLAMIAKMLAGEVGPRGVRVLSVLPGTFATARNTWLNDDAERTAHEAGIPLRRVGRPEEFGKAAAFLLSPAASYITGTPVLVDGGVTSAL